MEFKDCIDFANQTNLAWLATSEDDQPRVRPLGLWFADEYTLDTAPPYKWVVYPALLRILLFFPC